VQSHWSRTGALFVMLSAAACFRDCQVYGLMRESLSVTRVVCKDVRAVKLTIKGNIRPSITRSEATCDNWDEYLNQGHTLSCYQSCLRVERNEQKEGNG
jgi:hypothetical protein